MADPWRRASLTARKDWAEGLTTFRFDVTIADFEPGQFVNVAVDESKPSDRRSYSVASAPGAPLELYVTRVPGGTLSPGLFEKKLGDAVLVSSNASGFFTLDWVPQARDLWLISTGTGLGPFVSMVRSGKLWPRFERVVVVNGVRMAAHLGYRDELVAMTHEPDRELRYVPLVTREDVPEALRARVPAAIASGELERHAGVELSPDHSHVMLCGNPDMIKETLEALAARGLRKHKRREPGHVSMEKYW